MQPTVMMFGSQNAPGVFNDVMYRIFDKLNTNDEVTVYIDDVIGGAETEQGKIQVIRKVLQKCREAGMILNIKKCQFEVKEVNALGKIIKNGRIYMENDDIKEILEWYIIKNW